MFRAEIRWLRIGPTLKMKGRLVGRWAEQATCVVSPDVVPKGLIVDLNDVMCVDAAGEHFLTWLDSLGAVFAASTRPCSRDMRAGGFVAAAKDTSTAAWK